jgi:hypothetical protein
MDHFRPGPVTVPSQEFWRQGITAQRLLWLGFSPINCSIGSRINNKIRTMLVKKLCYCTLIRDIKLGA